MSQIDFWNLEIFKDAGSFLGRFWYRFFSGDEKSVAIATRLTIYILYYALFLAVLVFSKWINK